jgi:FkbM family methyltransferase
MFPKGKYPRVLRSFLATIMLIGAVAALASQIAPFVTTFVARRWKPQRFSPSFLVYAAAWDPESECGRLYATSIGLFWAQEAQAGELEIVMREQAAGSPHVYERDSVAIRRGDVVIDGGAHLGAFTRIALQRGAAQVIAFEPQPAILACLRKTFASEIASGQVVLVPKAVWEQTGTLEFHETGLNFRAVGAGATRPVGSGVVVRAPATTIDETVAALGLSHVDFIKLDIEGSERHALRGARETLSRFKPNLAVCVYHRPDDAEAIPAAVREARNDYAVVFGPLPLGGRSAPGALVFFPRNQDGR